ncbi:hypothetical protein [Chryseobacterium sp. Leaf405]|uniref:hypothetical protein n=1 Tax=Chryseobacterium sp. Leaf405 TaxID=1736367 RepID=UPI00103EE5EF|nr:hypothetical protein [Chryseobacterium sp. Leaf405]
MKNSDLKNKPITEYTNEELISNEKKVKTMTIMLAVAMVLMFFTNIFTSTKGFNAFSIMPMAFIPILVVNINNLNKLKKEIKDRNI